MRFADFIRKLAIVLFVLDFIGAFLLAKEYSMTTNNHVAFLFESWISSGVSCALLYSVGEVLEYLYSVNSKMTMINEKLSDSISQSETNTKPTFSDNNSRPIFSDRSIRPAKGYWRCKNCGKDNMNNVGTCGCGTTQN